MRPFIFAGLFAMLLGCGGDSESRRVQQAVVHEWTMPSAPQYTSPRSRPSREWVRVPAVVQFHSGSAQLTPDGVRLLDQAVASMRTRTDVARVRIEGHADSHGTERGNYALSMQRAEVVRQHLISRGVPNNMLDVVGYGSDRPRVVEDGYHANRQENRRVEFSVLFHR